MDPSARNISIYNCDYDCRQGLTITTQLKLMPGPQCNGGIVFNYAEADPWYNNTRTYQAVLIDVTGQRIGIYDFYGGTMAWAEWSGFSVGHILKAGEWYELKVQIWLYGGIDGEDPFWYCNVFCSLTGVTDTAWPGWTENFPQSLRNSPTKVGLAAIYAHTRFSWFQLDPSPYTGNPPAPNLSQVPGPNSRRRRRR